MARPVLTSLAAAGAIAAMVTVAPLHGAAQGGQASAAAALVEPVQYRGASRHAGRQSLFEPPSLRQPGSLFPSRPGRIGPHYEPPPVRYEPPPAVYEPPTIADRSGRCLPRTRAWRASCAARYRSFDPERGTYTAYSGRERPCRCP